ncbi:MAG: hypothetical protein IT578_10090 [Verrucomicrobiae bacterium]|nr:hypothetical protein [Verrucomicrobiae bacterium]
MMHRERCWQAGFAEADLTPRPGEPVMMSGYGIERAAAGALAPLRAQALAITDAQGRSALLLTADVLAFDRSTVERVRRELRRRHRLPPAAILFSASHTHWGPATLFSLNFSVGAPNPWFLLRLENTLLELAGHAMRSRRAATLRFGATEARLGVNRRRPRPGGGVEFAPHPEGSYDPHTPVLDLQGLSRHGEKVPWRIVVVGHGCHPTGSGLVSKWWPEYPGAMRTALEQRLGRNARVLFVQGCAGDVKPAHRDPHTKRIVFSDSPSRARTAGRALARTVMRLLERGPMTALAPHLERRSARGALVFARRKSSAQIEKLLRQEPPGVNAVWARQMQAYGLPARTLPYEAQSWRLGRALTLLALEGEVCSPYGPRLRAMTDTPHAMVVAYANASTGYIPTARIVREGGYEGDTSHMAYLLPAPFTPAVERAVLKLAARALGRRR